MVEGTLQSSVAFDVDFSSSRQSSVAFDVDFSSSLQSSVAFDVDFSSSRRSSEAFVGHNLFQRKKQQFIDYSINFITFVSVN